MADVTMRQLLEAGVHFGHQTQRWDPKMRPYIFSERNGIHIIDLRQTLEAAEGAADYVRELTAKGGTVLFVGTKKQAQGVVVEASERAEMPFVNHRWLGGMLTNFQTVKQSIKRLKELEQMSEDGTLDRLHKKEALMKRREMEKLQLSMGGIKDMGGLPDAIFIIDVGHEKIAVQEANKLGIPVVAVVDTNNSPLGIDYIIPGNDDAIGAITIYAQTAATAVLEGQTSVANAAGAEDEFVEVDEQAAEA